MVKQEKAKKLQGNKSQRLVKSLMSKQRKYDNLQIEVVLFSSYLFLNTVEESINRLCNDVSMLNVWQVSPRHSVDVRMRQQLL